MKTIALLSHGVNKKINLFPRTMPATRTTAESSLFKVIRGKYFFVCSRVNVEVLFIFARFTVKCLDCF